MFDLNTYLDSKRKRINSALNEILRNSSDSDNLTAAINYSIMAGGKRLRPVLCIAGAESVGGDEKNVLRTACALEMIHTYSLIHDDLPAMDNDDLRRGKPTCHIEFDEATAILAGDALLTLAFQILSSIDLSTDSTDEKHAIKWIEVINMIAQAAGPKGMIGGQMLDIASEGKSLPIDKLKKVHYLKTGALIEASVCSGAILGGGRLKEIEHLKIYAKNIGLAFQVTDDILNVEGDPIVMGKAVGTDKQHKKATYPSLLGIEKSKLFAKDLVNNALQALGIFDNKSDPLRAVADYIIERKK